MCGVSLSYHTCVRVVCVKKKKSYTTMRTRTHRHERVLVRAHTHTSMRPAHRPVAILKEQNATRTSTCARTVLFKLDKHDCAPYIRPCGTYTHTHTHTHTHTYTNTHTHTHTHPHKHTRHGHTVSGCMHFLQFGFFTDTLLAERCGTYFTSYIFFVLLHRHTNG